MVSDEEVLLLVLLFFSFFFFLQRRRRREGAIKEKPKICRSKRKNNGKHVKLRVFV